MMKYFHYYCKGDVIIFRDEEDYVYFNNRFAILSYAYNIAVLGLTIMSTHFHALIQPNDDENFEAFSTELIRVYSSHYSHRYGYNLGPLLNCSKVIIDNKESLKEELNYVLKNPLHHYVVPFPCRYPYGSAAYLFVNELIPQDWTKEWREGCTRISRVTTRRRKEILGKFDAPDTWLVDKNNMILPTSYLKIGFVNAIYDNSVRSFLWQMNKNSTDASHKIIMADVLELRCASMNDIEVCRIADEQIAGLGIRSHHFLSEQDRTKVIRVLQSMDATKEQIRRCLWL
ncbi:MAG: hypothetical protein HUJ90_00330 [Bacteroidales bacterium]|nr:hypothetical protein [Bacteroidales bacterium]